VSTSNSLVQPISVFIILSAFHPKRYEPEVRKVWLSNGCAASSIGAKPAQNSRICDCSPKDWETFRSHTATSKLPAVARMASLAGREIIAAECALAVMTGHTALGSPAGVMISRFGSGDLTSLRQARSYLMTIIAIQFLRRTVFSVAEVHAERRGPLRSSAVTAELMTRAAGRNVSVT
jgi:hypothetical protein